MIRAHQRGSDSIGGYASAAGNALHTFVRARLRFGIIEDREGFMGFLIGSNVSIRKRGLAVVNYNVEYNLRNVTGFVFCRTTRFGELLW